MNDPKEAAMAEHTPGRLAAYDDPHDCVKIGTADPDGPVLARMEVYASDDPELNDAVQSANARRLVALWNACEGIATKDLETVAAHAGTAGSRLSWLSWHAGRESRKLLETEGRTDA